MSRKKRRRLILVLKLTGLLLLLSVAAWYIRDYFTKPVSIRYPEFGISIPAGYSIHGIDVSKYQKVIDWEEVKSMQVRDPNGSGQVVRIGFAFVKATEGVDNVDPQFRRNWLEATKQEIPKGAYHYFIAGKSGKKQAENFTDIVHLEKGDLPPVLDIEDSYGVDAKKLRQGVTDWLKTVEGYYGVKPVIYANIHFYNKYLLGKFNEYPFWVAHYLAPDGPRTEQKWKFWQHSEKGRVNGIRTMVDFNVFSGDSTEFRALLIQ